jgi:hypothetical protein
VWPGRVHSPLTVERQREIVMKSVAWIGTLHPNAVRGDDRRAREFS